MLKHLSDIGFHLSEETFSGFMCEFIRSNEHRAVQLFSSGQLYFMVPIDDCIEFWFPVINDSIDISNFALHYFSSTMLEVTEPQWLAKTFHDSYGLIRCRYSTYFFNFLMPNATFAPAISSEKHYKCQVSCFAENISVYKNVKQFEEANPYTDSVNGKCFMPSISLGDTEERFCGHTAHAWISGEVHRYEKKRNSYTNESYYRVELSTIGAVYDVLISADDINSPLKKGDIIAGEFWLYGKLFPLFKGDEMADIPRIKAGNPRIQTLGDFYRILRNCWKRETAYPPCQNDWRPEDPSFGQCAVTAMLVHDLFGGTIHKIKFDNGSTHYFNKINNCYVDLTSEQIDLYSTYIDYSKNEVVDRKYCGKNVDTQKRYKLLVDSIATFLLAFAE